MATYKTFWDRLKATVRSLTYIGDEIDTVSAAEKIKGSIWFRGTNVWILAFSIIIASVGLNVNSTAVIIGAMLISPLMGPIIGIGLALGTNDVDVLKNSFKNLLVMVLISVGASFLYFLITPLNLANPTELAARTHPSLYDVLIALFGGFAGIVESSRKDKGTVLSGVAIATALMPPLCTAGYGLANGNFAFFGGAMFLFLINGVFIILATYLMVGFMHFPRTEDKDIVTGRRRKRLVTAILVLVIVPSIWGAVLLVRENNFERDVRSFVEHNKSFEHGYIYDWRILPGNKRQAEIYIGGGKLDGASRERLAASAERIGLKEGQLIYKEQAFGSSVDKEAEKMMKGIYERADEEIARRDERIRNLEEQIRKEKDRDMPYAQLAREVRYRYPAVKEVTFSRGASVETDSLHTQAVLQVITRGEETLNAQEINEMSDWLKVRLNDTTVTVLSIPRSVSAPAQ